MKIGPVDTEIALLIVKKNKKEEINASKIYSPSGKFAERAKKRLIVTNRSHTVGGGRSHLCGSYSVSYLHTSTVRNCVRGLAYAVNQSPLFLAILVSELLYVVSTNFHSVPLISQL